jgi:hypothetical protein
MTSTAPTTKLAAGPSSGSPIWARSVILGLSLAAPLAADRAAAEPLAWSDVAKCYDRGVYEHKPIVMLLYDKPTSRFDADVVATRLSLSPKIQAVASKATWCFGDVSSDLVSRNLGKALQIKDYPSVSILAPDGAALDETARVVGMTARLDGSGFQESAEVYIVVHVEQLWAKYHEPR